MMALLVSFSTSSTATLSALPICISWYVQLKAPEAAKDLF
jgi:hypothetical protein